MRKYITLSVALLFTTTAFAQQKNFQNNGFYANEIAQVCKGAEAMSDQEVIDLITTICTKTNNKNRFVIAPCGNISNCQATLYNNRPYIMYNTQFLNSVKGLQFTNSSLPKEQVDWKVITLLAHEVAHHVYMHLINPDPDMTQRQMELEADEFAGYTIYMLGGSLENAQAIMHTASVSDKGSYTHPPRAQRLDAIQRGYIQAQNTFPKQNGSTVPQVTVSDAVVQTELNMAEEQYNNKQYDAAFATYHKYNSHPLLTAKQRYQLASMYYYGMGVIKDYQKAFTNYTSCAEAGNGQCQLALGRMYDYSQGVPGDFSMAMYWYNKAAAQDVSMAIVYKGWLYANGQGVPEDNNKALALFRDAADKGEPYALFSIGWMYDKGKGVSEDPSTAVEFYKKAADKNDRAGIFALGGMYETGRGVTRNVEKAKELYQKAASRGLKNAQEACTRLGITW